MVSLTQGENNGRLILFFVGLIIPPPTLALTPGPAKKWYYSGKPFFGGTEPVL